MKKLKSLVLILAAVMFIAPFTVKADEKVKVYIFEAGGCPYCEMEMEYLKQLDSYGKKFEIVQKELYVDHVEWEPGEDYDLGVKVANAFLNAGFSDASYQGTPFVVISDIYAAATYSEDLEQVIDKAYEEGDKDVVSCIADGGNECLPKKEGDGSEVISTVILVAIVAGIVALIVFTNKKADSEDEVEAEERGTVENHAEEKKEEVIAVKKEKVETKKKQPAKKASTTSKKSKSTTKSTSKKK